jgi:hypothetical protein
MIPRLDWWPMRELWPHGGIKFSVYVHAGNDALFPQTVTKVFLPDYCFGDQAVLLAECPSSGLQTLMANAEWLRNTNPSLWQYGNIPGANITMPLLNNEAMRFLGGIPSAINRGNFSLFAASAIPDFLASAIWAYYTTVGGWQLPGSNDLSPLRDVDRPLLRVSLESGGQLVNPRKPGVQVECGAMPFGVSDVVFPYDLFMTSPGTDYPFLDAD